MFGFRIRVGRVGSVHGIRDSGHVLVQHRVHVHFGVVPDVHPQLNALHMFSCRSRRLAGGAADTPACEYFT